MYIEKKKVLVVSYVFNLSNTVRAYAVYKALQDHYNVKVLYADYDHYSKKHVVYPDKDFSNVSVPAYKTNFSPMRIISSVIFSWKTIKEVKKNPVDLVYVICPPNLGAYLMSRKCKKNNIICMLDIVDLHPESIPINQRIKNIGNFFGLYFWKNLRDRAIKYSDKVIVECEYYISAISNKYKDKISTIYLSKKSEITHLSLENIQEDVINIVYLGSIGHIYDFDSLINLSELLMKNNVKVNIHIIGDGEKRAWLLDELTNKHIPYTYYGKIYDEKEKQKIMEFCDFGFNGFKPETSVGLSYKSIDYMDYGLALINSTKHDTWNLIENHGAGLNYSSDNIPLLVDEIVRLDKDEIVMMKKKSRQLFEHYFDSCVFETILHRKVSELLD